MPDIGFGEILVIVALALLVFGPDRLPKMAADAARTLRQVRLMAASARRDLVDAAGLTDDAEMAQTVRDLRELDPRRAMQGLLTDDTPPSRAGASGRGPRPRRDGRAPVPSGGATGSDQAGAPSAGGTTGSGPSAGGATGSGSSDTGGVGAPVPPGPEPAAAPTVPPSPAAPAVAAPAVLDPAPVDLTPVPVVDPDWT